MPERDMARRVGRFGELRRPVVLGMGLVALDVVIVEGSSEPPRYFAGGTCGNVLSILGFLGWDARPISRLGTGGATKHVVEDLERWNVSTRFVTQRENGSTPVIIERLRRSADGTPQHRFSWRCPSCGTHLPGYKPVLATVAQELAHDVKQPAVFFFDRVSRGVLAMAEVCRRTGAVVVFEPSAVAEPELFREAWKLSHVVKYSHERLRDIADVEFGKQERQAVWLEVETLGAEGLRYRSRLPDAQTRGWEHARSFPVPSVKDTAGAGDWCTAGLIERLARKGSRGLKVATLAGVRGAFRYAQAASAWNCAFEAPRGGMYHSSREAFARDIAEIIAKRSGSEASPESNQDALKSAIGRLCPGCEHLGQRSLAVASNSFSKP